MQDTKPNWPVVGGVYKHRKYDISARVLGIEGGDVINRYIHPSGSDGGMGVQTSVEVFRMGWFPEDQSSIPALVAALKWHVMWGDIDDEDAVSKFERIADVFRRETGYLRPGKDCRLHSHEERTAIWDAWIKKHEDDSRAALALAGESEKESEDAG